MFEIGPEKIILILLVALIVLGPDKLPETARKIGNVVSQLRRMSEGIQTEVRRGLADVTDPSPATDTDASDGESRGTAA
jgi:sec-independent protein translocase protein TatB